MIQFNYTNAATGVAVTGALAWVANTNIGGDRVTMTSDVQISFTVILPSFQPFDVQSFTAPYNPASTDNPAQQMYTYLMTNPFFANATIYPPAV